MEPAREKFHFLRSWGPLFAQSFNDWMEDRALRFSAALAYYSIFAMAPLVIIAIAVAGLIFGEQAARGQVYQQIEWLLGAKGATEIQTLIQASSDPHKSVLATVVGIVTLLIGASGVFGQLKDALNTIWGVRLKPGGGIGASLREYLLSFSMVVGVGFLLIISLLMSAVLQAINNFMTGYLPIPSFVAPLTGLLSLFILIVLFALIFKVLPDVEIGWNDVWIGATVTALLFTLGKALISLYLGTSSIASSFGAAGALILLLVWVYYSTTIFLLGAEFTQAYARKFGSGIRPSHNATFASERLREEQGMPKKIPEPEARA
ncbi:MAG: YihY/virulence factor BrkB family protein [Chthoniobacterales bacterium]|nr:YihY/virulence factor BrkB family protein [Chthoniobacterales bacterium]